MRHTLRSRLAATALLAVLPGPAQALDYWIDAATGSDTTGDGSQASPWRSITRAVKSGPMDNLWIGPGIYDAAHGERFPITLTTGSSGGWAWRVHGSKSGATIIESPGAALALSGFEGNCGTTIEDLTVRGSGASGRARGPGVSVGCSYVALRRLTIRDYDQGITAGWGHFGDLGGSANLTIDDVAVTGCGTGLDVFDMAEGTTSSLASETVSITNALIADNDNGIHVSSLCDPCPWLSLTIDLRNVTIARSSADAIQLEQTGGGSIRTTIRDSILTASGGWGIDNATADAVIQTSDLWQNLGGDMRRGTFGPGCLFLAPGFVDAPGGDFHLAPDSPCIDAGGSPAPDHDLEGNPRPLDGDGDGIAVNDMGAYESPTAALRSLRRADFATIASPAPDRASAFPFAASNPRTPVVWTPLASGDADPTPGILDATAIPLAFYEVDPPSRAYLAVKDSVARSVRFVRR